MDHAIGQTVCVRVVELVTRRIVSRRGCLRSPSLHSPPAPSGRRRSTGRHATTRCGEARARTRSTAKGATTSFSARQATTSSRWAGQRPPRRRGRRGHAPVRVRSNTAIRDVRDTVANDCEVVRGPKPVLRHPSRTPAAGPAAADRPRLECEVRLRSGSVGAASRAASVGDGRGRALHPHVPGSRATADDDLRPPISRR